jgi:hypothetical protein
MYCTLQIETSTPVSRAVNVLTQRFITVMLYKHIMKHVQSHAGHAVSEAHTSHHRPVQATTRIQSSPAMIPS